MSIERVRKITLPEPIALSVRRKTAENKRVALLTSPILIRDALIQTLILLVCTRTEILDRFSKVRFRLRSRSQSRRTQPIVE